MSAKIEDLIQSIDVGCDIRKSYLDQADIHADKEESVKEKMCLWGAANAENRVFKLDILLSAEYLYGAENTDSKRAFIETQFKEWKIEE